MALPEAQEHLPSIVAAQGIDPESIDIVVNSHLHFDHCGGNTILTDAGPIAARERFDVGIDDDAGAVFERAAELTPDLIAAALENERPAPQGEDGATYAEKIGSADRELDWSVAPEELHNRIRALSPHIGARGLVEGRPVIVWRSRLVDGGLELLEVQPEGRRRMTYDEFVRGLR